MGLGEKLNFYRKEKGISQEKLAEIMGVSRQSVSLWENNQTVPSMQKLVQLSEVLEISMDELLDKKNHIFDKNKKPIASGSSQLTKEMIDETMKMSLKRFRISSILLMILCAYILIVFIFDGVSNNDAFIALPAFLLIVFLVRYYTYTRKLKRDAYRDTEIDPDKVYEFDFYDDYVNILISSSKTDSKVQIQYEDFDKVLETDNFYMLIYLNRYYSIDKNMINGDEVYLTSVLKNKMKKYQSPVEKIENKKPNLPFKKAEKLKIATNTIFILTIFTMPIALFLVAWYSSIQDYYSDFGAFEDLWIILLVLPLPLSSVLLGVFSNKNGLKGTKNIILGGIMTGLVIIYSSFSLVSLFITDHNYEYLNDLEAAIQFDFPDTGEITTQMQNASSDEYTYKSESDVLFTDDAEIRLFEQTIQSSGLWTSSISTQNIGMLSIPATFTKDEYDYFLIYNSDLDLYNQLPNVTGSYNMIYFAYNTEDNVLKIMEYTILLEVD